MPVDFSPEARAQIEQIQSYIAEHGSPATAARVVERLVARCEAIGNLPFGGTMREELEPGLRSVPFEKAATIYYRVSDTAVLIAAVLYRGRDQAAYFGRKS